MITEIQWLKERHLHWQNTNQTQKHTLVWSKGKWTAALNQTEEISRSYSQFSSHKFKNFEENPNQAQLIITANGSLCVVAQYQVQCVLCHRAQGFYWLLRHITQRLVTPSSTRPWDVLSNTAKPRFTTCSTSMRKKYIEKSRVNQRILKYGIAISSHAFTPLETRGIIKWWEEQFGQARRCTCSLLLCTLSRSSMILIPCPGQNELWILFHIL